MKNEIKEIFLFLSCEQFDKQEILKIVEKENPTTDKYLPIITHRMKEVGIFKDLSTKARSKIYHRLKEIKIKSLAIELQLRQLASEFNKNKIEFILLKGVAFNYYLYNGLERDVNDIDILVKEKDWVKSQKILSHIMDVYNRPNHGPMQNKYEISFIPKATSGFNVDLHSQLFYKDLFDYEQLEIWETKKKIKIQGLNIYVLNNEQALIHQAIHCYKDICYDRYSILDVYYLRKGKVNSKYLYDLIERGHCKNLYEYFNYRYDLYNEINNKSEFCVADFILKNYSFYKGFFKNIIKFIFYISLHDKKSRLLSFLFKYTKSLVMRNYEK